MRGILIFCILGGIFLTITHKTEKQNYLTKKEMKNILAGVTCVSKSCKELYECVIRIEIEHCPYSLLMCGGQNCVACAAGVRKDKRCAGTSGILCKEWLNDSCASAVPGYCMTYPSPIEGGLICYCLEIGGPESGSCGKRWECENL